MDTIEHVLTATDLSEGSLHAIDRGFQIAQAHDARYSVMHALGLDAIGPLRGLFGERADEVARRAVAHQRQALQDVVDDPQRNQGVLARLVIEEGLAASTVPAYASTTDADLVLVGAKGESAWRRLVLGSTASHLLRKSRSPVLVVKNPGRQAYRRILVAVDFSPCSVDAVHLAATLAPQAELVLLNVFEVPFEGMLHYAGVSLSEIQRYQAQAHERALRQLRELAASAGLAGQPPVVVADHGHAVQKVLEQEKLTRCDLIVMGKHGTHVTEELLLGSVTKRVLDESDADLLVVVDKARP